MTKIKLLLRENEFTSFTSYYLEEFWRQWFDIEIYDATKIYDKKSTIIAVHGSHANSVKVKELQDQGFYVAVDNLWERSTNRTDYYWIENKNWFWYNESLWWRSLGYSSYVPNKKLNKLGFMQIRRPDRERDLIITRLQPWLDNFLYSYKDKKLPGDDFLGREVNQRYFNPNWYNTTFLSLVVESNQTHPFITEKTFKPMAYYHPYLIVGPKNHLNDIRTLGFETFENLFDESYDTIDIFEQRLNAIVSNLNNISLDQYDKLTLEKLTHNHDLFFNESLVKQRIVKEIVEPLLNYAET